MSKNLLRKLEPAWSPRHVVASEVQSADLGPGAGAVLHCWVDGLGVVTREQSLFALQLKLVLSFFCFLLIVVWSLT